MGKPIRLSRPQIPKFPDRCVYCGAGYLGDSMKVPAYPPETGVTVAVPACHPCRRSMRRPTKVVFRLLLLVGAVVGGFFLAAPVYDLVLGLAEARGLDEGRSEGLALAAGAACWLGLAVAVGAIWKWLAPPAVWIEASASEVVFHFSDDAYASEFEALNSPGARQRGSRHEKASTEPGASADRPRD